MEIFVSYFDKDGNEKEIEVSLDGSGGYDGIGPYEYWGSKGYDKGSLVFEISNVSYDKTDLTQEEIDQIEQEIQGEKFQSAANEKYSEYLKSEKEAAAEAKYESMKDRDYWD